MFLLFLTVSCTSYKALDFEGYYEGEDVRAEFLKQYQGSYRLPAPESGTIQGLDQGNTRLVINADGSYLLVGEKMRVSKNGDKRSAICNLEEKGTVTHVQKFTKTNKYIQVGRTRLGNFDPVGGLLVLEPQDSKFTHAETVKSDERGDVNVDKEDPFSEKDFKFLCARTKKRIFYVENFLREGLLLARKTDGRNGKFFLEDRLIAKEDVEWLWLEGELAQRAVAESSLHTRRGITGLQVLKEGVKSAGESTDRISFAWDSNVVAGDKVTFSLGAKTNKSFTPFWMLTGTLVGVSYSPQASTLVANVREPTAGEIPMNLESSDFTEADIKKIEEVWASLKPGSDRINALDKVKTMLTVDLPVHGTDTVRVDSKIRQILAAKESP